MGRGSTSLGQPACKPDFGGEDCDQPPGLFRLLHQGGGSTGAHAVAGDAEGLWDGACHLVSWELSLSGGSWHTMASHVQPGHLCLHGTLAHPLRQCIGVALWTSEGTASDLPRQCNFPVAKPPSCMHPLAVPGAQAWSSFTAQDTSSASPRPWASTSRSLATCCSCLRWAGQRSICAGSSPWISNPAQRPPRPTKLKSCANRTGLCGLTLVDARKDDQQADPCYATQLCQVFS